MANEVTKKDGAKQAFDAEKIKKSIADAAEMAGLSEERKNEIKEQVSATVTRMAEAKEEIATSEIKEKILSELDAIESSVSEAWRKHEQEKTGNEEEKRETPEP